MRFKKLKVARMLGGALGLLLALSLVLVPAPALAVPPLPHQFYGTVTIDTELAPEGTIVSARIGGIEYLSATVDADGRYGYAPLFKVPADDPDTPEVKEGGVAGETVEFYVLDTLAGQYEFEVWGVTELNLSIGEAPPPSLTAEAGGPYSGTEGATIGLSGSASSGTSPYTYAWDLDNDSVYDDATGASPSHSWDTAGTYTIGLQVTDNVSATATDTATVTVTVTAFDPYIYDTNEDEVMSKAETLAAVDDYLAGNITKDEVLEVVKLYFS